VLQQQQAMFDIGSGNGQLMSYQPVTSQPVTAHDRVDELTLRQRSTTGLGHLTSDPGTPHVHPAADRAAYVPHERLTTWPHRRRFADVIGC